MVFFEMYVFHREFAMRITITEIGGVTTLVLKGALVDPGPVAELHLTIDHLLTAGRKKIMIDLRMLSRIDTVGMGEVFGSVQRVHEAGSQLSFIPTPFVEGRVVTRTFRPHVCLESCVTEGEGIKACSRKRRVAHADR